MNVVRSFLFIYKGGKDLFKIIVRIFLGVNILIVIVLVKN